MKKVITYVVHFPFLFLCLSIPLSLIGFFVFAQFYLYRRIDSCCLEWYKLVLDGSSGQVVT